MKSKITLGIGLFLATLTYGQVTYTVTTVDDTEDVDLNDAICADTNGNCSLRAAIQNANKTFNKDTIEFNLSETPPFVFEITTDVLTPIQRPAVLDGRTQPGYTNAPLIEIDGTLLAPGFQGVQITGGASGSEMYGLSIGGFQEQEESPFNFGYGLLINFVENVIIQGNYIGLRSDGSTLFTNTGGGVLSFNSSNCTIGGIEPNDGNLISGNFSGGLTFIGGENNLVQGNLIGTDITGTLNRGNRFNVQLIDSSNNIIGGSTAEARNIISGGKNDQDDTFDGTGFSIVGSGATGNSIIGNYIGTDITGTQSIPNLRGGVLLLFGANNNEIGGINAGEGNLISGNGSYGVYLQGSNDSPVTENLIQGNLIGVDMSGNSALPNQLGVALVFGTNTNNTIGGLVDTAKNTISENSNTGIVILSGQNNSILGNYVGTNSDGNAAVANNFGISINDANNSVGGTSIGSRNIISGNTNDGLSLESDSGGTLVQGNFIGTDATGNNAIPNLFRGVFVDAPSTTVTVGGSELGRNIISGNDIGIAIRGTAQDVSHNYIGLNAAGTNALPNQIGALALGLLEGTQIHHNVISGNGIVNPNGRNLLLSNASQLQVFSNIIGLQANGFDIPDGSNNVPGVLMQNSSNNSIGGATADFGNVISGNSSDGILMIFSSNNNQVLHNLIGLAVDGETVVGNGGSASSGVVVSGNITSNLIASNIITGSTNGVFLDPALGVSTGVTISQNSIYGNTNEGIRLAGANVNDPGDADTGPNNLQNYPEITNVNTVVDNGIQITYQVPSDPSNSAYPLTVEFFGAVAGQGKTYLGTDTYASEGSKVFTTSIPTGFDETDFEFIVGTATDANGNTSEFGLEGSLSSASFELSDSALYPNPAQDWFKLNLNAHENYSLELISITGQLVNTYKNVSGEFYCSVENLPQGVYLINIFNHSKDRKSQKKLVVK